MRKKERKEENEHRVCNVHIRRDIGFVKKDEEEEKRNIVSSTYVKNINIVIIIKYAKCQRYIKIKQKNNI